MLAEGRKQMPVDVAVSNIGGIRAPLYEGRITVGDVFKILPFDNALVVLSLRGATLDSLAADIVAKGGAALAGMTIEVRNGVAYKVQVGGEPVDAEKIYNVVTNDYLSWGNDGFTSMASYTAMHNMNMMLRDAMLNYIQSHPQQQAVIAPTDKCLIYTMP